VQVVVRLRRTRRGTLQSRYIVSQPACNTYILKIKMIPYELLGLVATFPLCVTFVICMYSESDEVVPVT
jgi:hypothetical protein